MLCVCVSAFHCVCLCSACVQQQGHFDEIFSCMSKPIHSFIKLLVVKKQTNTFYLLFIGRKKRGLFKIIFYIEEMKLK